MRWPIRNQILLPLLSIQVLITVAVTSLATWWSLERAGNEIHNRLHDLSRTLARSSFPLTPGVLDQLQGLSGADFAIFDPQQNIIGSTLPSSDALHLRSLPQDWKSATPAAPTTIPLPSGVYLAVTVQVLPHVNPHTVVVLYPEILIQAARRDALALPVLFGLATLGLTGIVGIGVAQHIGRRIQAIERQVARVAQGDFRQIPLSAREDELRDLSASVNRMSLDLERLLERLTGQIRITERAQLIKQLTGGIAHQLRNSLTGARMAVQLHQRRCGNSADESLDVALRQLTLTEEQIRGLGALMRDEHRERIRGPVDALVREVVRLVQPMCHHRRIEFVVTGELPGLLVSDTDQIRAALLNLCINAIEATAAGGQVRVLLQLAGMAGSIEVWDDGPGVPAQLTQSLFDPFQTTKPEGMGLGLALVRQAAEDHHGSVTYSRDRKWTIFRFTFQGQLDESQPDWMAATRDSPQISGGIR